MSRHDPEPRPPHAIGAAVDSPGVDQTGKPSKTRRKAEMHALQDLGVALVELDPKRLDELAAAVMLPERLLEAISEARAITAWGGRKRALQYVGKLMRTVDPGPIRKHLDDWAHGRDVDAARQRSLERWRERLLAEPDALDALATEYPAIDRAQLRSLIVRSRDERGHGAPPHAFRELFRVLKALDAERSRRAR